MNFNVCYVFDKDYIGQFKVSIYSLIVNNRQETIMAHLLTYSLGQDDRENIASFLQKMGVSCKFYEIDEACFKNLPKMRASSYACYYKLLIPDYLKDQERVLFLDCDIIVRKPIHEFFFMQTDKPLTAVADSFVEKTVPDHVANIAGPGSSYFNSGVMLFDFTKADHPCLEEMLHYGGVQFSSLMYHDQDILNHFYQNRVCFINDKYNYITNLNKIGQILTDRRRQKIIHYAGTKPWDPTYKKKFYSLYVKYYNACKQVTQVDYLKKRKPLAVLFFSYLKSKASKESSETNRR